MPKASTENHNVIPADVASFGRSVAQRLGTVLGSDLVGVYFVGSVALGGYVRGQSDIDLAAVCEHDAADRHKESVVSHVLEEAAGCPTRGVEITLYRRQVASSEPRGADFEVNVNGGPGMAETVRWDSNDAPAFWFVLDRAIAHRHGIAVVGPPAEDIFADAPRPLVLRMLSESLRWHRQHKKATVNTVLNAARAWRFASDDVLGSKLEGATWARCRWPNATVVDAAVDLRLGRPAILNDHEIGEFLDHVEQVLASGA